MVEIIDRRTVLAGCAATLTGFAGCNHKLEPQPGQFGFRNNASNATCHLYFLPQGRESQKFDALELAGYDGRVEENETIIIEESDHQRIRNGTTYEVRGVACNGNTTRFGRVNFERGAVARVHEW